MLYAFGKAVVWLIFGIPFRTVVRGRDRVPRQGPLLVLANHISFADPPLVAHALPRPTHFMAMAELFRNPVLAWLVRGLNAFPVDRQRVDSRAVREAVRRLQAGEVVTIFPEGGIRLTERSVLGGQPEIRPGATLIAELGGCPILPTILRNSRAPYDWRNWFRRPVITVTFGAPFCLWLPAHHSNNRERRALAQAAIRDELLRTVAIGE